MYIKRDSNGQILALSQQQDMDFNEWLPLQSAEIQAYLKQSEQALDSAKADLASSDSDFIRVLEDLIELLTLKGLIQFTELPSQVQQKLIERKNVRAETNKLNLFDETNHTEPPSTNT